MKIRLHIAPLLALCLSPLVVEAQVLPGGGGAQPAPAAPATDNAPAQSQPKKGNLLGDALPFMDPGSETVQWDGKMFSVTNSRVFRARLEKYLASPEANEPDDQAYRDVLEQINTLLSPNHNSGHPDLPAAVALLPIAAQYKIDAKLSDSMANAIFGVWQAQKNVAILNQTNVEMKNKVNSMHFMADHHTENLTKQAAASTKGGKGAAPAPSPTAQAGQLGLVANYIKNVAEYETKMKVNEASMGLSQVTAKLEFQALIMQFAIQRRFEHVVMATRFYRNIFSNDPNGVLQLKQGSDAEKMFATSLGTSPTIGALDAFANEMIRDVDEAVQAFDSLLERGDMASASQRISEAFMVGEYLPRVRRVPAMQKLKVLDFTRDANQLISAMEVKDYTLAEQLITKLKGLAKDFDYTKPQAAVETARTIADMHLNKAKVAAMQGDQKNSAEALKEAAAMWPTNPKLKEFTNMIGTNADIKTQAALDLDRLISQRNYRQIYNDQGRYLAAVMDDPGRQESLKKVLTDMNKMNLVIAAATSNSQNGNVPGAYEIIEKAFVEFPEDPEVGRLRSDLSIRATDFVSALQHAKHHEESKQSGSALAWYLKARSQYPPSEFAREGINRLVQKLQNSNDGAE